MSKFGEYFNGIGNAGEYRFLWDKWIALQHQLVVADIVFRLLSAEYGWKFLGNIVKNWPARGMRKWNGFVTVDIRLVLNADTIERDDGVKYDLVKSSWWGSGAMSFQRKFKKIRTFSVSEVSDRELLAQAIEKELKSSS
jgi:hypothetical protein